MVIDELRSIQDRLGFIPEGELRDLSKRAGVPVCDLHAVASFYPQFRLKAPPRAAIHVCTDLPCHLKSSESLLEKIRGLAGNDPAIEVKSCSCLGQCDGAPAMLVNDSPVARQWPDELLRVSESAMRGEMIEPRHFASPKGPFRTDPYDGGDRYGALKQLVTSGDFAGMVAKIKEANLRGMGGGGFPAHIKWNSVRAQAGDEKYIVCNADESEVGTFKDREILKLLPHVLVEAMTIAGLVTGAKKGIVYIRHEYHEQAEIIRREIAGARSIGFLGADVWGSGKSFELEVFISPGGYIQGEETALLEALEGRRGQPRNKPCIPAVSGLWGKPTLINNVETFAYVPAILLKGPAWFKSQGVNGCEGLKWIGVGGQVNQPGVFEVPMGTTYEEALKLAGGIIGGRTLKAFASSGPSFGFLPPSALHCPMDFPNPMNPGLLEKAGGTVGSAAIIMLAEGTCMVDAALNFTRFYRNESCGKCVPCRLGSQKMVDIIAGITHGTARGDDLEQIDRLGETMVMTSICGLGQVVHKPIQTVMKHWRAEVEDHLLRRKCPSGVCFTRDEAENA